MIHDNVIGKQHPRPMVGKLSVEGPLLKFEVLKSHTQATPSRTLEKPFAEENVVLFNIDFHAKMKSLVSLPNFSEI